MWSARAIYALNTSGKAYLAVDPVCPAYDWGVSTRADVAVHVLYWSTDAWVRDADHHVPSSHKVHGLYGVSTHGKHDSSVESDGSHYHPHGKDKALGKSEFGNFSHELVHSIDGTVDHSIGSVWYYGVSGDCCVSTVVVHDSTIV